VNEGTRILIVGLAAYLLFMRQEQASNGSNGQGSSGNGSSGSGSGLLDTITTAGNSLFPDGLPQSDSGVTGGAPFSPSQTVVTADGQVVGLVTQACPSANNPWVGTVIDGDKEIGVCAGDPRINNDPTYQPLDTPATFSLI